VLSVRAVPVVRHAACASPMSRRHACARSWRPRSRPRPCCSYATDAAAAAAAAAVCCHSCLLSRVRSRRGGGTVRTPCVDRRPVSRGARLPALRARARVCVCVCVAAAGRVRADARVRGGDGVPEVVPAGAGAGLDAGGALLTPGTPQVRHIAPRTLVHLSAGRTHGRSSHSSHSSRHRAAHGHGETTPTIMPADWPAGWPAGWLTNWLAIGWRLADRSLVTDAHCSVCARACTCRAMQLVCGWVPVSGRGAARYVTCVATRR
jgi:hypothetical protein